MKKIILVISFLALPYIVQAAGLLTLPFEDSHSINAYMDLDDRFDWVYDYAHPTPWQESVSGWTVGQAYDGHNGTDYNLSTDTEIMSALGGTVNSIANGYLNTYPSGPVIFGNFIKIDHVDNYQTIYAHLETDSLLVSTSSSVTHGMHIADSGNSGYSSGPHLHFEVRDNGTSVDPYSEELWTTDPPTLSPIYLSNHTISATSAWLGGRVYIISGTATVNLGVTLTIEPGTVVKFYDIHSGIEVNGSLIADGTISSPIYFTSYKDDSVGGDTNGDATSTIPAVGNWKEIKINSGGNASFDNVIVRYGGAAYGMYTCSNITNNGGLLNFSNSTSTSGGDFYGIRNMSGTSTVTYSYVGDSPIGLYINNGSTTAYSNTFNNNSRYGVANSGGNSLSLFNNIFSGSGEYDGVFDSYASLNLNNYGNIHIGPGPSGFMLNMGLLSSNKTIRRDGIPYIIWGTHGINSGHILAIEPGVILKFYSNDSKLRVDGNLFAEGTLNNPIYFTSYKDDSVGGDTNGDEDSTSPAPGDWTHLYINTGEANLENVVFKYAGYGSPGGNIYNSWGTLSLSHSTSTLSSVYGIYFSYGTTTINHSELSNQYMGMYITGGVASISSSTIHDNSGYGLYNATGNNINAENNWWGASSGPYHPSLNLSGTGNEVSNNIDFDPWLASWP